MAGKGERLYLHSLLPMEQITRMDRDWRHRLRLMPRLRGGSSGQTSHGLARTDPDRRRVAGVPWSACTARCGRRLWRAATP